MANSNEAKLTYAKVTEDILRPMFKSSAGYFALLGLAVAIMVYGGFCWYFQLTRGLGAAGYQPPVFWGVYITTFVFWVGIGHAGTLISAVTASPDLKIPALTFPICRCWSPLNWVSDTLNCLSPLSIIPESPT